MQKMPYNIVIFLAVVSAIILLMLTFIFFMTITYRKRQNILQHSIERIKLDNEKVLLNSQLEIQEQTFQHISREIHDNISLSLTLAKLNLHTFDWENRKRSADKIAASIDLLTSSIAQLSDISKSLDADIITHHGLLEALEKEVNRIRKTGLFELKFVISGSPVYMESQRELIIFRIIQEAFNNIIKHASASAVGLELFYYEQKLVVNISDNGKGFDQTNRENKNQAGLRNMETRTKILSGEMNICSRPGTGTSLTFNIPLV